ncbi:MAG TPA: Hsp20/alpha crystallin family protein [Burkholderiaceae bacterium]|nr:Hsp20/alpha crystallin family protein [Burkholderiaceae bacterium]
MFVFTASPAMQRRALRAAGDPRVLAAACHRAAAAAPRTGRVRVPSLDIVEAGDSYVATLDMPGIAKEQFSVSIEGRRVDISTQAAPQADGAADERAAPRYARSFVLPSELEPGAAQARLANGVLTLTLPKRAANRAATVTVQ